ncbi:unnamed protein product [Microthlaspi erraticum]|uniref:Ubiquitin-like protease family profile domain-containing protein n=1 Tax=Microthlaspi erraticum TaxID=1685480 RepID=A0A6D2IUU6_9BRAS|nr:unnamed protein product [Microthlaspi erraticum]
MEDSGLPQRMFQSGNEPTGRKRVNNYFNLEWVDHIKALLEEDQLEQLAASQFGRLMQMGNHVFSVMFLHYILSRQLSTKKKYELWWLFAGKPIRYGIDDFALVTGLDCRPVECGERKGKKKKKSSAVRRKNVEGRPGGPMWFSLFGTADKPTPSWIFERLTSGRKFKDPLARFRLALILPVEGILCPQSGSTNIRPSVVEMVADIDAFLKYPWGRESFELTVTIAKARSPQQLVQPTTAIQGFSHAMVLVTVCCCPRIISGGALIDHLLKEAHLIEDVIHTVISNLVGVNIVRARTVDLEGQAVVRSLLCETVDVVGGELHFPDEAEDDAVAHMKQLIEEDYPFEHNTWAGGVTASEAARAESDGSDGEESDAGHQPSAPASETGGGNNRRGAMENDNFWDMPMLKPPQTVEVGQGSSGTGSSITQLADAFEERARRMFVVYTESVKGYEETTLEKMKTQIAELGQNMSRDPNTSAETEHPSPHGEVEGTENYNQNIAAAAPPTGNGVCNEKKHAESVHTEATLFQGTTGEEPTESTLEIANSRAERTQVEQYEAVIPPRRESARVRNIRNGSAAVIERDTQKPPAKRSLEVTTGRPNVGNIMPPKRPRSKRTMSEPAASNVKTRGTSKGRNFSKDSHDKVAAFEVFVNANMKLIPATGLHIEGKALQQFYNATAAPAPEIIEGVVRTVQLRHDACGARTYDFIPPSYITAIKGDYGGFISCADKDCFVLSDSVRLPLPTRPQIEPDVTHLYCPYMVDGTHWVGIVIDIPAKSITVLDYNTACVSDAGMENYLQPLAAMLPYVIRDAFGVDASTSAQRTPFPVKRLDIALLCLSAVAALALIELHATKQILASGDIEDDTLRTASRNYAVSLYEYLVSITAA